jgi:HD-GYP domain-containing protein (c-di-GMP phosphodiesterase class II)
MTMIRERRGTMYDPDIADAFLRIVDRLHSSDRTWSLRVRAKAVWARRASRILRMAQEEARAQ